MGEVIQVKDLTKFYGPMLAVDHISFGVKEGEVFGFLGPNGAGKTTTIRMMVGLTQPSSGTAWVDGHDVMKEPVEVGYFGNKAYCLFDLHGFLQNIVAIDPCGARTGLGQAYHHPNGGGFSCTIGSKETKNLSFFDVKGDMVNGKGNAVRLGQIIYPNNIIILHKTTLP